MFHRTNYLSRLIGIAFMLFVCAGMMVLAPIANAADAAADKSQTIREILVYGSPKMYWVARVEQDPPGAGGSASSTPIRTYIQYRNINDGEIRWNLIAKINTRVVSLADRGSQVAALLESGEWMLLWQGGSVSGVLPNDGSHLTQLASSANDDLWAIGSASASTAPPTTTGSTQPASTMPMGTRLLYRLKDNQWQMVTILPDDAREGELAFAIAGAKPTIAVLRDGLIKVFAWNIDRNAWESSGEINPGEGARRIKLLADLNQLELWAGSSVGGGKLFIMGDSGRWSDPISLSLPAEQASTESARDPAVAGESIRMVVAGDKSKLTEYTFDPRGSERGSTVIPLLQTMPGTSPLDWGEMLMAALLMGLLFNSFRNRTELPETVAEVTLMSLAPMGRRVLAGVIDALPVIGTAMVIAARLGSDGIAALTNEVGPIPQLVPYYIAIVIYMLHTVVSECLWGYTIGKRLLGLRVIGLDGLPAPRGALFLRNILRAIDVAFAFIPTTLIFFTPLRQRLGDLAADTLVVVDGPVELPPDDDQGQ